MSDRREAFPGCDPSLDDDALDELLDGEEGFDCHMGPDGACGAAGSELCEFDCPYRRDQRMEALEQRARRRGLVP